MKRYIVAPEAEQDLDDIKAYLTEAEDHEGPADQMIVATAWINGSALMTMDEKIIF